MEIETKVEAKKNTQSITKKIVYHKFERLARKLAGKHKRMISSTKEKMIKHNKTMEKKR